MFRNARVYLHFRIARMHVHQESGAHAIEPHRVCGFRQGDEPGVGRERPPAKIGIRSEWSFNQRQIAKELRLRTSD